jgi:hypothetical protein
MLARIGLAVLGGLGLTGVTTLLSAAAAWVGREAPTWLHFTLGVTSPGVLSAVATGSRWLDAGFLCAVPSAGAWALAGGRVGGLAGGLAGIASVPVGLLWLKSSVETPVELLDLLGLHLPLVWPRLAAHAGFAGSVVGGGVVGIARGRGAGLGPGARCGLAGGFAAGFMASFASMLLSLSAGWVEGVSRFGLFPALWTLSTIVLAGAALGGLGGYVAVGAGRLVSRRS